VAKTSAPILSFGASGQIGKTVVFGSWRGVKYARQHVTPSNPQTASQTLTRSAFSFLQSVYKVAPVGFTEPWAAYAKGKQLTDRNAFTKFNLPVLREETDLANFVFSPGALGGLPPTAVVATPGSGQLSIAITAPSQVPTDWVIAAAHAAVILDQDPQTDSDYEIQEGEDATSAYVVVITGLAAALQRVGAWLEWTRPDGLIAYSPSIVTSATPS